MAGNFTPNQIDFSWLTNLPDQFEKGAGYARQRGLRNALSQGLPTTPDGSIDWAKAASIVGQFDPALGMRTAAYAQKESLTPYQEGMLGVAKQREDRLAQGPEVTPVQQQSLDIQNERLRLAKEANSRLPQNAIGATAMMDAADKELTPEKRALLTREWSATELAGAATNIGEVARAQSLVRTKVEAALRLMTGAAAPEQEVSRYIDMFQPSYLDSVDRKKQKLRLLDEFSENAKRNALQGRPLPNSEEQQPAPQQAPQPGSQEEQQLIQQAREAIAAGADPEAVAKRLQEMGISPNGQ